jgi:hypothetical protein
MTYRTVLVGDMTYRTVLGCRNPPSTVGRPVDQGGSTYWPL